MKREEAIKLIDTHTVCFYNEIDSPTLQALHLAIEALSAEAVQGWIPISERLPEKDGWYLVTVQGYETVTDVSLYSADGSAWGDVSTKQKVTAWMPLPKPYREGGEA